MRKIILATALTLMCSSAFAADDMNKGGMTNGTKATGSTMTPMNDGQKSSTTGMSQDGMKNDGMKNDGMKNDGMNKDMSKDDMKKNNMK